MMNRYTKNKTQINTEMKRTKMKPYLTSKFMEAEEEKKDSSSDETKKAQDAIDAIIDTDWGGSNESQGKTAQLFKALAFNDSDLANKFMDKVNNLTTDLKGEFGSKSEKKEHRGLFSKQGKSLKEFHDEYEDEYNDYDDEEIEPDEEDIYISDSGRLGSQTSVSAGGKVIGEFDDLDDAEKAIKVWMKKNRYYPNVWYVDDHGGIELYTLEK